MSLRTLFSDTFTRADAPTLGANWDGGYTGETDPQIVSNLVEVAVVDGPSNSVASVNVTGTTALTNMWDQFTLTTFTGAGLLATRLRLRQAAPPTITQYSMDCRLNDGGGNKTFLNRTIAGSSFQLAADTVNAWVSGDVVRFEINGAALDGYGNGILRLSGTDSTIASGRAGISMYVTSPGTLTDNQVDLFRMGDIGGLFNVVRP